MAGRLCPESRFSLASTKLSLLTKTCDSLTPFNAVCTYTHLTLMLLVCMLLNILVLVSFMTGWVWYLQTPFEYDVTIVWSLLCYIEISQCTLRQERSGYIQEKAIQDVYWLPVKGPFMTIYARHEVGWCNREEESSTEVSAQVLLNVYQFTYSTSVKHFLYNI
jgi:hypothetical protein